MRVLPCGEHGALVELESLPQVMGMYTALRERPLAGAVELVPAARTLLVRYDAAVTNLRQLADDLARRDLTDGGAYARQSDIEVPVRYYGQDLAEVASLLGMTEEEVVKRHEAAEYTVAFSGFAPGFAYITGGDPALRVSRRDTPRTEVPRGAVAIAGEFTAVYPRKSPGGWRIIGHTDLAVWDLDRDPPMLLVPGSRLRFVRVDG